MAVPVLLSPKSEESDGSKSEEEDAVPKSEEEEDAVPKSEEENTVPKSEEVPVSVDAEWSFDLPRTWPEEDIFRMQTRSDFLPNEDGAEGPMWPEKNVDVRKDWDLSELDNISQDPNWDTLEAEPNPNKVYGLIRTPQAERPNRRYSVPLLERPTWEDVMKRVRESRRNNAEWLMEAPEEDLPPLHGQAVETFGDASGVPQPYPQRNTQLTGKGSIADAKGCVSSFLQKSQNRCATNIEEGRKESTSAFGLNSASNRAGKEFLGQDSTRVDEATDRVNMGVGAANLKGEAMDVFGDASGAAGTAKDAASEVPQAPGLGLYERLASKIEDVKSDLPGH